MYYLPLTKGQRKKRAIVATEIWELSVLSVNELAIDMQRVALMENIPKYRQYFQVEFKKLVHDLVALKTFGDRLHRTRLEYDYRYVWDDWLELRSIIAKYIGCNHPGIRRIDKEFATIGLICLLPLPDFEFEPRPTLMLSKEEWDRHPNKESSFKTISGVWMRQKLARPYEFEDLEPRKLDVTGAEVPSTCYRCKRYQSGPPRIRSLKI
jgi:hypothetical protein